MHLWGAERQTPQLHHLRARHQSQPGEDRGHPKCGLDHQPQGRPKANGLPSLLEPVHLAARGARDASVQAAEKVQPVAMDGRGIGGL
jgi:hypothetical protein